MCHSDLIILQSSDDKFPGAPHTNDWAQSQREPLAVRTALCTAPDCRAHCGSGCSLHLERVVLHQRDTHDLIQMCTLPLQATNKSNVPPSTELAMPSASAGSSPPSSCRWPPSCPSLGQRPRRCSPAHRWRTPRASQSRTSRAPCAAPRSGSG